MKEAQALNLICGGGSGLTALGNALVSRQAKALLDSGLIDYAPGRKVGYKLTKKGEDLLKASS